MNWRTSWKGGEPARLGFVRPAGRHEMPWDRRISLAAAIIFGGAGIGPLMAKGAT